LALQLKGRRSDTPKRELLERHSMQDRPSALGRFLGRPPKALNWTVVAWVVGVVWLVLAVILCVAPNILRH